MKHRYTHFWALALTSAMVAACGGSEAGEPGTLDVVIYGEELIEDGIPASVFADGWSVRFDTFLVSVGAVTVAAYGAEAPVLDDPTYRIFDLAQPSGGDGFLVLSKEVAAGDYDDVSYRVAGSDDAVAGNASAQDVALMNEQGYAVYVEGRATREDESFTFSWGFTTPTTYAHCRSTATVDGSRATSMLTIHADHLFYDDLVSEDPDVRFDAIAGADADGDGDITAAELAAVDITGFERYQVGSLDVAELWTFIDYQVSTLGHIDGEGHCEVTSRD